MENFTPEQKQPIVKTLAITGLIGVLVLFAWLAIQLVQVLPTAVSSLASLANSVYTYDPGEVRDLTVSSSQTMVNVNEPVTLRWEGLAMNGTYAFSYECEAGVALSLSTQDKNFPNVACDTSYDLGTATSAAIAIAANGQRFTEISYKISFFRTNDTKETAAHNDTLTVVNTEISTTTVAVTEPEPEVIKPEPVIPTPKPELEPEPEPKPVVSTTTVVSTPTTTPAKPKPAIAATSTTSTPKPAVTATVPSFIYAIPTSNPNGTPDLAVTLLGIGSVNSADQFVNSGLIRKNKPGALQFSVHNIGQKTSTTWNFTATLPGDTEFTSSSQTALKPNERAVITIEFPEFSTSDLIKYGVEVQSRDEAQLQNNYAEATTIMYN